jgi:hypothetical protein
MINYITKFSSNESNILINSVSLYVCDGGFGGWVKGEAGEAASRRGDQHKGTCEERSDGWGQHREVRGANTCGGGYGQRRTGQRGTRRVHYAPGSH